MTEHIRRFVSGKEKRSKIIDSFRRLFGSEEAFDRISGLSDPQDREDELFMTYANQIRAIGGYAYTCPAVVLHPVGDRTYFHLIYATRNRKGVEAFIETEKAAFPERRDCVQPQKSENRSRRPSSDLCLPMPMINRLHTGRPC